MKYALLEKTELWVSPVELHGADLRSCARAAGRVLGLNPEQIVVTDVIENRLTFDLLVPEVRAEQIIACEKALIRALANLPGVRTMSETTVHSSGVLGLISLDEGAAPDLLERSRIMGTQIAERIRKRVMVFPTGQEVLDGQIQDTNTPFLIAVLESEGYHVVQGPTLPDEIAVIARAFRLAAETGYGLVVTTGGIGAEGKDQTLEALAQVDPQPNLPYILKFQKGQGRHAKDGVRIGVGLYGETLIICLPGPHDEVRMAWPVMIWGLKTKKDKEALAEAIADVLRQKFLAHCRDHTASAEMHSMEVSNGPK